jgi:hypothetical protein
VTWPELPHWTRSTQTSTWGWWTAVVAVAERLRAEGIATLDLRHFGTLELPFKLYPRDC